METVFGNNTPTSKQGPRGISGWLVLPIIGFILTIILTSYNLYAMFIDIEGIKSLVTTVDPQILRLRVPVIASIFFGTAIIFSASICLYKLFVSKTDPRFIAVIHYVILVVAGFVELWGYSIMRDLFPDEPLDPSFNRDAVRFVVAAAIWIPYFLLSKRVKNTFVNRDYLVPAETQVVK